MSTINTHKHNGNFKPLLQSFSPEQKQMQKIIREDKKSGDMQGARAEWKQLRASYTPQQQGLSNQARQESGMPLIDWQPGSGQYLPIKSTTTNPSPPPSVTSNSLNYPA